MGECDTNERVGAAVLAAGYGERMRGSAHPKPLTTVAGLTLLERTVRTLRLGGVAGPIVVVVGHRQGELREFVADRRLQVEVVENHQYARGNGTSVLAAMPHLPERFVVAMADHVHPPESVRHLLGCEGDFVAGVDARPMYADPDEATRVRIEDGRVTSFGKGLVPYRALDTGLFVCSRTALAELAPPDGEDLSWNQFKRMWLESGREIVACDISGTPWVDVDSIGDIERATQVVLSWAGSGKDGFVSRHVNRNFSKRITRQLLRTGLTANHVSAGAFLLAAAGAGCFSRGRWLAGAALVQLSSVVDGCDGEVARARLEYSPYGAVFDATLDRWADALVVTGMALGAKEASAHLAAYPALTGTLLVPYTRAKLEASFGETPEGLTRFGATRDVRLAVLCLGALLRRPTATLAAMALASNAEVLRRLLSPR